MAHYAVLDDNNIVIDVFAGNDEGYENTDWEQWYSNHLSKTVKRTSCHMVAGVHTENKEPFRKNYAGLGYTYDESLDGFIPPKFYQSWVLNEETCQWDAPSAKPEGKYVWDENSVAWIVDPRYAERANNE